MEIEQIEKIEVKEEKNEQEGNMEIEEEKEIKLDKLVVKEEKEEKVEKLEIKVENLEVKEEKPEKPEKSKLIYDLYGVVNHSGSLSFGHCFAYCKNKKTGKWYEHNDSSVSEISKS